MTLSKFHTAGVLEAGCDEAGRGCLAGSVYAAAVILPESYANPVLNDSKKLTHRQREELRKNIEEEAVSWAVAFCTAREIDEINILNASWLAMHRALADLKPRPAHIIVDGNRFRPFQDIAHHCIVKGDGKFLSIAAASVLAKTHRDEFMEKLDAEFPGYGWKKNKAYPTLEHRKAILEKGITPWHRKSFRLTDEQLKIQW